jgi:hypothetical protein
LGTVNGVTPVLNIAPTAAITDTAPAYTDLIASRKVERIKAVSGKTSSTGHYEVGTLEARIDNSDNALDPDNALGPYAGNLVRDRQVLFQGIIGGTTYDQWHGYLDRIVVEEPSSGPPMATLYAVDALGLLARYREQSVGFRRKVLTWSPAPSAYYRLGDKDAVSTAYDETGNRRFATHGLGNRVATAGGLVGDADGATSLGTRERIVLATNQAAFSGAGGAGLFLLIYPTALPASGGDRIFEQDVGGGGFVRMDLQADGKINLQAPNLSTLTTSGVLTLNAWNAIGFRRQADGVSFSLFRSPLAAWSPEGVNGTASSAVNWQPSWPIFGGFRASPTFTASLAGALDEIVMWSSTDPDAFFVALARMAFMPGWGESGRARFQSILDWIQFPTARRSVTSDGYYEGTNLLAPHAASPSNGLAAMQKLGDSVSAEIFANRSGTMAYQGYTFPVAPLAVTASFSDDNTFASSPIEELQAARPDLQQFDRVTANDGVRSPSVATDGATTGTDLVLDIYQGYYSDLAADAALRTWRRTRQSASYLERLLIRFLALDEGGSAGTTQRQGVLGLDLFDPIQATRHPAAGGSRAYQGRITRREITVTDQEWEVVFATAPVTPPYVAMARASNGAHQPMANNTDQLVDIPGERWDTDAMHQSTTTAVPGLGELSWGNQMFIRPNDRYLAVAQGWWAGNATGLRESSIDDPTTGAVEARIRELASATGPAQIVGVLFQAGATTAQLRYRARQTSGGTLEMFSSELADANFAASPEIAAVRIPTAAHAARVTKTASASVANATHTVCTMDGGARFNVGGMYSGGAQTKLTAQKAGSFFFLGNQAYQANASGSRIGSIRRNGGNNIGRNGLPSAGGGEDTILQVSSVWKMALNDYVEMFAWQDSGGGLNLVKAANYSPELMAVELVNSTRAHKSASVNVASSVSVPQIVTFDTESWDDTGAFTPGNSYMTVQWDGPTLIWGNSFWAGNATGFRLIYFAVNGIVVAEDLQAACVSGGESAQCAWTIWDCRAGDVVSMWVGQNSGGNLALTPLADVGCDLAIGLIAAA